MEKIEKEILTMEKCRAELLFRLKHVLSSYLFDFISSALVVGVISFYLAIGIAMDPSAANLRWVIAALWLIPAPYFVGPAIYGIWKWIRIAKTPFTVVEDTLSGTDTVTSSSAGGFHIPWKRSAAGKTLYYRWEFRFAGHGTYTTSVTHFTWKHSSFRMGPEVLKNVSQTGDKFYLVLDERVKEGQAPKILLVYPQKYFIWQG